MIPRLPHTAGLGLALSLAPLAAQDLTPKAAPQTRPVVLTGATVHTVSGPVILGGTLWFDGGRIRGVLTAGEAFEPPDGAEVIDLKGRHVYPGLVVAHTTVGLQEIGSVRQSVDTREVGEVNPEVRAAVAVNPDSTVIPVSRTGGVLTMGVFPEGGLIPGRVSVMSTDGWTWADMTVVDDAGLYVRWPRRNDEDDVAELERVFAEARAWNEAFAADPEIPVDIRWQAMGPVLRGEKPVFLRAHGVEEITAAVTWALDEELRPVVVGGRQAMLCHELLERHDVMVVLGGTHNLPTRRDSAYSEPFTLPARLHEAGVRWCLATGGSFYNERNLPYHAATAVAYGLPRTEAVRGITLYAAQALGIADRVGSLEEGKDATLIVTTGTPLEVTNDVEMAWVQGRRVDLRNKQTELARKYREKYRQLGLIEER